MNRINLKKVSILFVMVGECGRSEAGVYIKAGNTGGQHLF